MPPPFLASAPGYCRPSACTDSSSSLPTLPQTTGTSEPAQFPSHFRTKCGNRRLSLLSPAPHPRVLPRRCWHVRRRLRIHRAESSEIGRLPPLPSFPDHSPAYRKISLPDGSRHTGLAPSRTTFP